MVVEPKISASPSFLTWCLGGYSPQLANCENALQRISAYGIYPPVRSKALAVGADIGTPKMTFKKLDVLSRKKDERTVGFLDDLGVKYDVIKIEHPSKNIECLFASERKLKEERLMFTSWQIILNPITKEQFEALRVRFKSTIDITSFDSERRYDILDFLPESWRRVMGGSFGENQTNCYSTALAALNSIFNPNRKFPLFFL